MKKTILILALAAMFLAGCSGVSKKEAAEAAETEKLIKATDSIAAEIEKTAGDIKESEASLDSLLNEL